MIFGRLLVGLGGETLIATNFSWIVKRFSKKNLTYPNNFMTFIIRSAFISNSLVTPSLNKSMGLDFSIYFGTIIGFISAFCFIIVYFVDHEDRKTDNYLKQ